jgi:hypothetical protein
VALVGILPGVSVRPAYRFGDLAGNVPGAREEYCILAKLTPRNVKGPTPLAVIKNVPLKLGSLTSVMLRGLVDPAITPAGSAAA